MATVADTKPVLSAAEKKALRTQRRLEREAREAALHEKMAAEQAEQFRKDTANWNERLLNAVLDFASFSDAGFSVKRLPNNRVEFTVTKGHHWNDTDHFTFNVVPSGRDDLWTLKNVEDEVQQHRDHLAEEERLANVRKNAVAKLTEEERKALGV